MFRRKAAVLAGMTVVLSGAAVVAPAVAQAACTPSVSGYGYSTGYSHNGARIFVRTVDVYNPCADTTWTMDIRPLTSDRDITVGQGRTNTYSISSSWGTPYVAGFKNR
jgi:hypothetical protein